MLVAVLAENTYQEAEKKLAAVVSQADVLEFRLDYFSDIDFPRIDVLKKSCGKPVIFTLRKASQGGKYAHSEETRLATLLKLCELSPDYLDLEYDLDPAWIANLAKKFPNISLLVSYHNYEETPEDLESILDQMQNPHCHFYKIACFAKDALDALHMMSFVKKQDTHITGISMGEAASFSRVLSPVIGNSMHYAAIDAAIAPGQISIEELISIYRIAELDQETKIYALLGDPVKQSQGALLHNSAFAFLNENAVYVKIPVSEKILPAFLEAIEDLPFHGFSITRPLKECILPLMEALDEASMYARAVNTVLIDQGVHIGMNTDGEGAFEAIIAERDLSQDSILILGAGGAARAIAYALKGHCKQLCILNRDPEKAETLAKQFSCEVGSLNDLAKKDFTLMINTLPSGSLDSLTLLPSQTVMDINYYDHASIFIKAAEAVKAKMIPGVDMFLYQALLQLQIWLDLDESKLDELYPVLASSLNYIEKPSSFF